ncbi:GNAT family N-acetyltransferase [Chengkuizengella sp. SCS-71B]|uniref:GNAT family N-acetyltransferase n=1 Tax=Chengkuizengella sp. SCS-71B TaxID=3115290 RepID=UPI0032C23CD9
MKRKKRLVIFNLVLSSFLFVFRIILLIVTIQYFTNNRVGVVHSLEVPPRIFEQFTIQIFPLLLYLLLSIAMAINERRKRQSSDISGISHLVYKGSPDVEDYLNVRKITGLSEKSEKGAKLGLKNTVCAISIYHDYNLIGMGRIIGDKGCFYQIVDVAVDPNYQGQGFGKLIMNELTTYLDENAPNGAYVSLIADEPADKLYEKYGFKYTYPASHGMYKLSQRSEEV